MAKPNKIDAALPSDEELDVWHAAGGFTRYRQANWFDLASRLIEHATAKLSEEAAEAIEARVWQLVDAGRWDPWWLGKLTKPLGKTAVIRQSDREIVIVFRESPGAERIAAAMTEEFDEPFVVVRGDYDFFHAGKAVAKWADRVRAADRAYRRRRETKA